MSWPPKTDFTPPKVADADKWVRDKAKNAFDRMKDISATAAKWFQSARNDCQGCVQRLIALEFEINSYIFEYSIGFLISEVKPFRDWIAGLIVPQRDPNTKLFIVENPYGWTRKNDKAQVSEVKKSTRVNRPLILIHGMGQDGSYPAAEAYWKPLFAQRELFRPDESIKALFVTWDSAIRTEDAAPIAKKLNIPLPTDADISNSVTFAAIAFNEMIRRARLASEALQKLLSLDDVKTWAFTHSLGSLIWAKFANENKQYHRGDWYCLSGALSWRALATTGEYSNAGERYARGSDKSDRLVNIYSTEDYALLAYFIATQEWAVGNRGTFIESARTFNNYDVTSVIHERHGPDGLYYSLLKDYINLFSDPW